MKFVERTINNYSGLSSETKPTIAAGNSVPNGSRWREVDTGRVYHFNLADDKWYETEFMYGRSAFGVFVDDVRMQDMLENILIELKKMNLHLSLMTNEEITEQDVGG